MTDTNNLSEDNLQFDQAEFDGTQTKDTECGECRNTIIETYFDVNGKTVCPACREKIETEQSGSGVVRFVRAILFGIPAALLGAGIYYGISALTGYEFGLVAIVIGLMVGAAVRAGSRRKGGWVYQTLAILLTYIAIVSTYIPYMIQGFNEANQEEITEINQTSDTTISDNNKNLSSSIPEEATVIPAGEKTTEATPEKLPDPEDVSLVMGLIGLVALLLFAMIVPFLAGFENILGLIIIAIGLYEAWKINKRIPLQITGPFSVSSGNSAAVTVNE